MRNHEGENIGVLQLIDKKKARDIVLDNAESFEQNVLSFDEHDDRLLRNNATPEQIEQMKEELARRLSVVEGTNNPTVRHHFDFGQLEELGTETFEDVDGRERPYLEPEEIVSLTVSRGP
jgi:hypothetical protein